MSVFMPLGQAKLQSNPGWLGEHCTQSLTSASPAPLEGFCGVSHSLSVIHQIAQLHSQLITECASPVCSEGKSCDLRGHAEWQCMPSVTSVRTMMQILSRFVSKIKVCYFCIFKVHIFSEIPH